MIKLNGKKKKIGIYSGTFDPIHDGHISFAREALDKFKLDKVFFLPEPRPRRKQGIKAFEHRIEMVNLALKDQVGMAAIILKQARFTPQNTLPVLQERFRGAQLYMLMGEDMLDHLADWPHVEDLLPIHFIIGTRKKSAEDVRRVMKTISETKGLNFIHDVFKAKNATVSSTVLRHDLRHGVKPSGIKNTVYSYITSNNLYSISGE